MARTLQLIGAMGYALQIIGYRVTPSWTTATGIVGTVVRASRALWDRIRRPDPSSVGPVSDA
jgi:hypothetical protein